MIGMASINPFTEKINAFVGLLVSIFSYVFGVHWILFVGFLVLNIVDYITGTFKAVLKHKSNSAKGLQGVVKKLGYWIMIMLAFGASAIFIEIGNVIGVNLEITSMIGWFVLATLIINEIRSIIENFVEAGYNVPGILTRGLQIAVDVIEEKANMDMDGDGKIGHRDQNESQE